MPSAGWSFDGWSGDVVGMANPISVTMDADAVIAADFVQAPPVEYLLDVTATAGGQVMLNPPGGVYAEGTTVELTAVADAGWQFSGWSGDLTGTQNPVSVVVTADTTVLGAFETDTSPPVISNIQVTPGQTSATVSWTTNEPTTGVVDYGDAPGLYDVGFVEDTALLQNHSVTLSGLTAGATYHLQISATDAANNTAVIA